jgi:hypothetical protein
MIAAALLVLVAVAPWVVAAVGGAMGSHDEAWLLVGAPSPFFPYVTVTMLAGTMGDAQTFVAACLASALLWAVLGVVLLGLTAARSRRLVREARARFVQTEAALADEDRARAAATYRAAASANGDAPRSETSIA